jgi:hypothetical protein
MRKVNPELYINSSSVSAFLNGSPVSVQSLGNCLYLLDLQFNQSGVYNLTIVYGDPEIHFTIIVQGTQTFTQTSTQQVPPHRQRRLSQVPHLLQLPLQLLLLPVVLVLSTVLHLQPLWFRNPQRLVHNLYLRI